MECKRRLERMEPILSSVFKTVLPSVVNFISDMRERQSCFQSHPNDWIERCFDLSAKQPEDLAVNGPAGSRAGVASMDRNWQI